MNPWANTLPGCCATMRLGVYSSCGLRDPLSRQTIATIAQSTAALGHRSQRTAVRKRRNLPQITSHLRDGRFHVLADGPRFDLHGLWSFRNVRFSVHGTRQVPTQHS